jgi:hypothetical protein
MTIWAVVYTSYYFYVDSIWSTEAAANARLQEIIPTQGKDYEVRRWEMDQAGGTP